VAFTTIQRGNLTKGELEGWCVILETLCMIIFQTFDTADDNDLPLFRAMYIPDTGRSPYLGANRAASIRKYTGGLPREIPSDPVQKKFAGLLAAYEARGTAVSCIEKELAIHLSQRTDRNTHRRVNSNDLSKYIACCVV